MNILLVVAMQSEIEYFLNNFELQKIEEKWIKNIRLRYRRERGLP